jgi:phage shock protein A
MAQSILGRIGQLVRANLNAALDAAEDPEQMLDQLVRDYSSSIREAEAAVAQTLGDLRLMEGDQREATEAVREWQQKAESASVKADQLRTDGKIAEADRFDNLARVALRRQISYEEQAVALGEQIERQQAVTDRLKEGLGTLRLKLDELAQKRNELVSRGKMARAQVRVQQAMSSASVMDPTSELNRFEDRVRREEAMARGLEEVSKDSLEEQFAQLEADQDDHELESRFSRLKAGQAAHPPTRD